MRIAPSDKPVVRPEPQSSEPRASFADLLGVALPLSDVPTLGTLPVQGGDVSTTPSEPSDRSMPSPIAPDATDGDGESHVAAAAFDAFGMFGRRAGVTPFGETPASAGMDAPSSQIGDVPATGLAVPHFSLVSSSAVGLTASDPPDHGVVRSAAVQHARRSIHNSDPSTAETPAVPDTATADEGEAGPVSARRPNARKATETEAHARLTLSDTADAAGLAVRLAGLSAEEAAQFRARARTLLGEHGLRLDKLDINGEDRSGSDLPTWGIKQWR